MKGKNVFFALGLSLVMGVGVAAAVANSNGQLKEARAEIWRENPTIYFIPSANWAGDDAGFKMNYYDNNTYKGKISLSDTGVEYDSRKIYSATISDGTWVSKVQFLRWDPAQMASNESSHQWNYSGTFTISDDYDDGINALVMSSDFATYDNWTTSNDGVAWGNYDDLTGATSYKVHVIVDGVERGEEDIIEGKLPANPTLARGEKFSGWFSDSGCTEGHEVNSITSATTVYGKILNVEEITYTLDIKVDGVFDTPYLYAWESGERKNAAWPGDAIGGNTITVYADDQIIITDGATSGTKQTVDITQSGVANDVLKILPTLSGEKYTYQWGPASDGYYLVGDHIGWGFSSAIKMSTESEFLGNNLALYFGYHPVANEELKVAGWVDNTLTSTWYRYGGYIDDGNPDNDDSNYVFPATPVEAGYDIYLNSEGLFWVTEHVSRHNVTIVSALFEGKNSIGTEAYGTVEGNEENNFEPALTKSGFVFKGLFTNSACTTEYNAAPITSDDVTLYAKFIRTGVYLLGDETFSGESLEWQIEGAKYLPEATNDTVNNYFEGSVTISGATELAPVEIRPAEYLENDTLDYSLVYSMGEEYDFASKVGNNIAFTVDGTYGIYVNKEYKVYLKTDAQAFYTKFLTEVGGVCHADGSTDVATLSTVWASQKAAFLALEDSEAAAIIAATIDGGNVDGSDMQKVIAKYKYIVTKYGTAVCEDFIWGETYEATSNNFFMRSTTANTNVLVITVITATVLAVGVVAAYALLKKKKER